jgi:hypothetical protein
MYSCKYPDWLKEDISNFSPPKVIAKYLTNLGPKSLEELRAFITLENRSLDNVTINMIDFEVGACIGELIVSLKDHKLEDVTREALYDFLEMFLKLHLSKFVLRKQFFPFSE